MLMTLPCSKGCTYDKRNTKKCKVCGWIKGEKVTGERAVKAAEAISDLLNTNTQNGSLGK